MIDLSQLETNALLGELQRRFPESLFLAHEKEEGASRFIFSSASRNHMTDLMLIEAGRIHNHDEIKGTFFLNGRSATL